MSREVPTISALLTQGSDTEVQQALRRIAAGMVQQSTIRPERREDAVAELTVSGLRALEAYQDGPDAIVRKFMRDKLKDLQRYYKRQAQREVLTPDMSRLPSAVQPLVPDIAEAIVERNAAEQVVGVLFAADWTTDHEKKVMQAMLDFNGNRDKAALSLDMTTNALTQVLVNIRDKTTKHGLEKAS